MHCICLTILLDSLKHANPTQRDLAAHHGRRSVSRENPENIHALKASKCENVAGFVLENITRL